MICNLKLRVNVQAKRIDESETFGGSSSSFESVSAVRDGTECGEALYCSHLLLDYRHLSIAKKHMRPNRRLFTSINGGAFFTDMHMVW